MQITYVGGAGRLGLPLAAWSAVKGHRVIVADINGSEVYKINTGEVNRYEPHVNGLVRQCVHGGSLRATTDIAGAAAQSELISIIVPTPSLPSGGFSNEYVLAACREIGEGLHANDVLYPVVEISSTVMPGSTMGPIRATLENCSNRVVGKDFGLVYSPEFIRQGSIVHDFSNPDMVLIGASDVCAVVTAWEYYESVVGNDAPFHIMSPVSAEIAKLSLNATVVAKMAMANTIAALCHYTPGADAADVLEVIGEDSRIGHKFFGAGTWPAGPCLPPSTGVQTARGLVPIENIEIGDRVLTHDGRYHAVTRVWERPYHGDLVRIVPEGFPGAPLLATPDHPVWAARRRWLGKTRYRTVSTTGKRRLAGAAGYSDVDFVPMAELQPGDVLALPRLALDEVYPGTLSLTVKKNQFASEVRETPLTPGLMRAFGWYIAEGSTWRKEIKFSLHKDEEHYVEDIARVLKKHFGVKTKIKGRPGNGIYTRTACPALAQYLRDTFGHRASEKRVPPEWLELPDEHLIQLLRGIWYGDGSNSDGVFTYGTVSEQLFNFLKLAMLRLGIAFSTRYYEERTDDKGVHHQPAFHLRVCNPPYIRQMSTVLPDLAIDAQGKGRRSIWFEDNRMLYHVKEAGRVPYTGPVYNLEVEGANSYMLENAMAHNCFPRDTRALVQALVDAGAPSSAAIGVEMQSGEMAAWLVRHIAGLAGKTKSVGILGLAYKPGVDMIEESQGLHLAERLEQRGIPVRTHDPAVLDPVRERQMGSLGELVEWADTLVLMTCWPEYLKLLEMDLKDKSVFDMWGFLGELSETPILYYRFGEGL